MDREGSTGLLWRAWQAGVPGAEGAPQMSMAVLSGGRPGACRFLQVERWWKEMGHFLVTMGHVSLYDSGVSSEVSLIQSFSTYLLITYCMPGTVVGPGAQSREFHPHGAECQWDWSQKEQMMEKMQTVRWW